MGDFRSGSAGACGHFERRNIVGIDGRFIVVRIGRTDFDRRADLGRIDRVQSKQFVQVDFFRIIPGRRVAVGHEERAGLFERRDIVLIDGRIVVEGTSDDFERRAALIRIGQLEIE